MSKKIGRNDPCPCGSGKKYKKCCLDKIQKARKRYKQIKKHWSKEDVIQMSTEQIIQKLYRFGVEFDQKEFLKDVENFDSAIKISEKWFDNFNVIADGFDQDFIVLAAIVLWERMASDKVSFEKIDDLMQKGYFLIYDQNQLHKGCDLWIKVWEYIKTMIPENVTDIKDVNDIIPCTQFISNWVDDFMMQLRNAACNKKDSKKEYYSSLIKFCKEFLEILPESDEIYIFSAKREIAESYFKLGEKTKAEKKFKKLVKEFPDNVFSYISWGDMYYDYGHNQNMEDILKAKRLYEKAIGRGLKHQEVAEERLADLMNQHDL